MSALLPFIIIGAVSGSVYGMAAVGLVLTYRTSGIFNFAHGALATLAAYVFYALYVGHGVPWPLAAVVAVLILGPALGITFERFARVLSRASSIMYLAMISGSACSLRCRRRTAARAFCRRTAAHSSRNAVLRWK